MLKKFMVTFLAVVTVFLFSYNPKVSANVMLEYINEEWLLLNLEDYTVQWKGIQNLLKSTSNAYGRSFKNQDIILGSDLSYLVAVMNTNTRQTFKDYFIIRYNGYWYYCIVPTNFSDGIVQIIRPGTLNGYIVGIIEREEREKAEWEAKKAREEAEKRRIEQEKTNKFNALISAGDKFYTAKDYVNANKNYSAAQNVKSAEIEKFFNMLIKNGDDLNAQKNYTAALDYYKKAAIMNPENTKVTNKIWQIYTTTKIISTMRLNFMRR